MMLEVDIPGKGTLELKHIVLDFNGTIAWDGNLLPGVEERLNSLAARLQAHIVTADTFGRCKAVCRGIKGCVSILTSEIGAPEKEKYVETLGAENVVAVGNGSNDALMLSRSALGIAIIGPEGAAVKAVLAADIVAGDINAALDMLLNPKRLMATLRL